MIGRSIHQWRMGILPVGFGSCSNGKAVYGPKTYEKSEVWYSIEPNRKGLGRARQHTTLNRHDIILGKLRGWMDWVSGRVGEYRPGLISGWVDGHDMYYRYRIIYNGLYAQTCRSDSSYAADKTENGSATTVLHSTNLYLSNSIHIWYLLCQFVYPLAFFFRRLNERMDLSLAHALLGAEPTAASRDQSSVDWSALIILSHG